MNFINLGIFVSTKVLIFFNTYIFDKWKLVEKER